MFPGVVPVVPLLSKIFSTGKITCNDFMISEEFNRKKRNIVKSLYFRTILAETIYKVMIYIIIIVLIIKYFKCISPKVSLAFNPEYSVPQIHYHLPGKVVDPSG